MKKKIILSILLILPFFAFAGDYKFFKEDCMFADYNNNLHFDTFDFYYSTDINTYYIPLDNGFVCLSEDIIKELRTAIEKYFEWEKIAVENKTKLTKDLPMTTKSIVMWTSLDNTCMGAIELRYIFFSQTEANHQLVIGAAKVNDALGSYSTYTMKEIYLTKYQATKFYEDLSLESLNKKQNELKKQLETESLFN